MKPSADNKTVLRKTFLEARRRLTKEDWTRGSAAIGERLEGLALYADAETLLTYVSAKDNEVDTHALIKRAVASGRRVLVPVVTPGNNMLDWSPIRGLDDLVRGQFDLLEVAPQHRQLTTVPPHALCIVPGIAFTADGFRLGYGGGYYDRFLDTFGGISIGLAFSMQLADALPVVGHDRPVRYILTDTSLISCQKSC